MIALLVFREVTSGVILTLTKIKRNKVSQNNSRPTPWEFDNARQSVAMWRCSYFLHSPDFIILEELMYFSLTTLMRVAKNIFFFKFKHPCSI